MNLIYRADKPTSENQANASNQMRRSPLVARKASAHKLAINDPRNRPMNSPISV
jgi:hypothetical protein